MKKIIIDTNAFLRFFFNDVPEQKRIVEELLQKAKKSEISLFVPQIVVFELHFILDKYYHLTKDEFIATIQPLLSTKYIAIESRELFLKAVAIYKSSSISFVDSFLLSTAKNKGAELFTFDQKLRTLQ